MLTREYSEKKSECSFAGVETTTFRFLVRMLHLPLNYRRLVDAWPLSCCTTRPEIVEVEHFHYCKDLRRWLFISPINEAKRCIFPMVSRGYSEKFRMRLGRIRTYELPITSSDAPQPSKRRLVGTRPLNEVT